MTKKEYQERMTSIHQQLEELGREFEILYDKTYLPECLWNWHFNLVYNSSCIVERMKIENDQLCNDENQ